MRKLVVTTALAAGVQLGAGPAGAEWSAYTDVSPVDDSTNIYLTTPSLIGFVDPYGREQHLQLTVRCVENTTMVAVIWDVFLSIHPIEVTYRIDQLPAETREWNVSTDFEAVGLWSGGRAIPFTKRLFDHDRLFMRVTPHGEHPADAVFDISALKAAAAPLMEACHWQAEARPKQRAPAPAAGEGALGDAERAFEDLLRSVEELDRQVQGTVRSVDELSRQQSEDDE